MPRVAQRSRRYDVKSLRKIRFTLIFRKGNSGIIAGLKITSQEEKGP